MEREYPAAKDVDGVILKTSDGSMYAMKHLENIWVKTNEISFAVKPDFVEPHGNHVTTRRTQASRVRQLLRLDTWCMMETM